MTCSESQWIDDLNSPTGDDMTLQVALTAKDGILLASDVCAMSFYPPNSAGQTYSRRKIVDLPEDKVTYAFSGDDVAEEAGRRLEKTLSLRNGFDFSQTRDELERLADEAYTAEKARHVMLDVHRVLLVVFYRDKLQLWKADIKDGASRAKEIGDFVAGDYPNTACFFKERYWRTENPRTLDELKLLAAHIILMGGDKIKRYGIEGLDIAVITPEKGFVRLSEDELKSLTKGSDELDRLIEARLFKRHSS